MKKIIVCIFVLLTGTTIFAKSVKFSVDMTGQTISPNGIHVSGDFQIAAGYIDNWNPAICTMLQEGSSNIYSIIVNIPAFQKYEYRFINGDLFYETEFIPVESQVGYGFNDNRWIYIDSIANDTTLIGAIKYGGNAPEGKKLVRFLVDMSYETVSANGVHVAGSFNSWGFALSALYSFESSIYEVIQYMPDGNYEYKFANGSNAINAEIVPAGCATNNNRSIFVAKDTIMAVVCFSGCGPCGTGINDVETSAVNIFPNPSNGNAKIFFNELHNNISINDAKGSLINSYEDFTNSSLSIANLKPGIYFIFVTNILNKKQTAFKYIVQ
ncbi:MAG: T9SS type A sorting domain-containing protein [Bacteroidales bacterium]|nr:T9SS type A sorting domain-containing protein [Bacteroidales bacterium]